jgi:tetratricopeptide (TPR) repeat protein
VTREEWLRIKSVAADAWEQPAEARAAFLASACAGNDSLREEVERLLRHTEAAAALYETPAFSHARTTLLDGIARVHPTVLGTPVGPYRVTRQLGRGGMGAVYLADRSDGQFEQRVAIKVVDAVASEPLLHRFRDERQILATLNHANIARLFDGGATADGRPCLVMEYVDGVPIDEFCAQHQLTVGQKLELFRKVCGAVHYAHQRLVVHRDIKAGNILVTPDGSPKLLDFGIAKMLAAGSPAGGTARTVLRALTPESASPEQVKGDPITIAADVYALGVLLYRLLTGRSPYGGGARNEAELLRAICETEPATPGIDRDLDLILLKALRKEPERRYGSVEQFSDDIDRYLTGRPVTVVPDSAMYRARRFIARHRLSVALAVVAVVGIFGAAGVAIHQAREAERERARAERHFGAVRSLAGSVMGELHDAVIKLPGSTSAQALLLTRATEYLDRLAAEVGDDLQLRREVARGYQRLGQVQGVGGLPNLGNPEAAKASYEKSVSILRAGTVAASPLDDNDRLILAEGHVRLAELEDDGSLRDVHLREARTLLDARTAPADVKALVAALTLWTAIATFETDAKDYRAAKVSLTHALSTAEEAYRLQPDGADLSRNLSIVYKRLGAIMQVLGGGEDPMPLYEKARVLDQARVDRDRTRGLWRLDLSFAYGSIASVLTGKGDVRGALDAAEKAVALRRSVAEENPDDDFARTSLARGYGRVADVKFNAGDFAGANDASVQYVDVYRKRLAARPERADLRRDFATAAWSSIAFCLDLAEGGKASREVRAALLRRARATLDEIAAFEKRWRASGQAEMPGLPEEERRAVHQRLEKLGR